jgi:hypothetical protein
VRNRTSRLRGWRRVVAWNPTASQAPSLVCCSFLAFGSSRQTSAFVSLGVRFRPRLVAQSA